MKSVSNIVSVLTGCWGIANLASILGIIVTILSAINILFNLGISVYEKLKARKYKEIQEDIQKAKEELERLKEEQEE